VKLPGISTSPFCPLCNAPGVNDPIDQFEVDDQEQHQQYPQIEYYTLPRLGLLQEQRLVSKSREGYDSLEGDGSPSSGNEEEHEVVFDIDKLRWENREEQHFEQFLTGPISGKPFAKLSNLGWPSTMQRQWAWQKSN